MTRRERFDLSAEAIPDRPQQRRRRDLMPEMATQEPHHLTADLQLRHVRVQIQPIDTLDLERHMTLEHVIDIRHARHPRSIPKGRLCRTAVTHPTGGGREGGLTPSR